MVITMSSLPYRQSLEKIRNFMFADLDNLDGKPNFLLALVLTCYTEYWGRIVKGIPSGISPDCFNIFFDMLGPCYSMCRTMTDVYHHVRCELVHSYGVEGNASINGGSVCGVEYDPSTNTYKINVRQYSEDLKAAVENYLKQIDTDPTKFALMEKALKGKAFVV
jgi:hypothetical protein